METLRQVFGFGEALMHLLETPVHADQAEIDGIDVNL
jgi:hypothetical protein